VLAGVARAGISDANVGRYFQGGRQQFRLFLMKAVVVLRQQAAQFAGGDGDAQFAQLFAEQRLGNVAVVLLIEEVADAGGAEVATRQDVGGQGGEQRLALGQEDAFAQVACDLTVADAFLANVGFVAVRGRPRRGVGKGNRDLEGGEEGGVLGAFVGPRAFAAWGGQGWGGRFEAAGGDHRSRFLPFAEGDLVAQLLDGLLQLGKALLLGVDDRQQRLDERGAFGRGNYGNLDPHTFQNSKTTPDQLRLCPRVFEMLLQRAQAG